MTSDLPISSDGALIQRQDHTTLLRDPLPMMLDRLYEKARRRAPPSLDFDGLSARYRAHNAAMVADWRERFPESDCAVLEITIRASGHARRRLRRYGEFADVKGGTPGILTIRQLTSFNELLDFEVIQIGAAAARADVYDIEWKLLSVGEALTSAP